MLDLTPYAAALVNAALYVGAVIVAAGGIIALAHLASVEERHAQHRKAGGTRYGATLRPAGRCPGNPFAPWGPHRPKGSTDDH